MARKPKTSPEDKIILEAKERFKQCEDAESEFRQKFIADLRFANGDPDNNWQWHDNIHTSRAGDGRPCLTINKTRQHNLQVINDAKKNKPSVKVLPVDDGSDIEVAKILDGIIRHIEYNSHAEIVYDTATDFAVQAGLGYWRVVTEYAHDGSFDQEIFLRRVKDPLMVYLDPDIQSADGADAKFAFVFEDISKKEFEAQYPDEIAADVVFPLEKGDDWISKDQIRIAEYFCKSEKTHTLINHPMCGPMMADDIDDPEERRALLDDPSIQRRDVASPVITWYKLAGDKVIDTKPWPGRYMPIVRVVGEEICINGKVDRKGHTRSMKDAQRMYNYMTSANVEYIALQTKTPFVAAAEAIKGYTTQWERANLDNLPYLPYNAFTDDGTPIERPQREQPPVGAQAYLSGMQTAQQELMMSTGQYQEQFGQQSNATAGVAITARQRQGDTATYHFIDNVARAIRYTGRILVDLIPKIYDTKRTLRIMGVDGAQSFVQIDPQQPHAVGLANGEAAPQQTGKRSEQDAAQLIYNPSIGRYDVTVDVGPNFETRRQEAFNALTQIMGQDPDLMKVAGDLLFKAADFPMADDVAERLHRTISPAILGDGPSPQEQQLQDQLAKTHAALQQAGQELSEFQNKEGNEAQRLEIDRYRAETDRMKVTPPDPQQIAEITVQLLQDAMSTRLSGQPPTGIAPMAPDPNQPPAQSTQPPSGGFLMPGQ